MKTSRLVLLALCSFSVVMTGCQPSAKRSARKIRVKDSTRSKQHFNFNPSEKVGVDEASVPATDAAAEAPKATVDTNNALCDRVVEGKCDAIRISALEDGTFDGIDRREAANAGLAKSVSEEEETITGKNVEIKIKFDDLKNRGTKLIVAAIGSDDLFKSLNLSNVTKKTVSATPTPAEIEAVKGLVKTPQDKVLVVAKSQEQADAVKAALELESTMILVASSAMTTRILREEILSAMGDVVPVNFITRQPKDQVAMNTLQVTLNGRALNVSKDFGTSYRDQSKTFRIYLIKRELLNADSELKITYSLK